MRKSLVAGILSVAAAGSLALSGSALAHDGSTGGAGKGGTATNNCLNVGIPILSGLGIAGTGVASGASCVADASGAGGDAY